MSLALAYVLSGVFLTGALAGFYFSKVSRAPDAARIMKVLAIAAAASAVICFGYPAIAGVLVLFWLSHALSRVPPYKNSAGAIILALSLVASCLPFVGTPFIPAIFLAPIWLIVTVWVVFSLVGAIGWFASGLKGLRW